MNGSNILEYQCMCIPTKPLKQEALNNLFVDNQDGTISLSFSYAADYLFQYVLTTEGNMVERHWDNEKDDWRIVWNAVNSECDHYGTCGAFGSCTSWTSPICSCLPGFEPKNTEEWNRGNWTTYAYDIGTGCMSWTRNLIDIQKFSSGGVDLYIRVAYSELGELFCYLSKFILCFKSWIITSTHYTH
ncbi:g-type lectin s-receptor-like serine/threonine-protein kinase [Quercus suber]|uniref:G-type lectin s-receptor-like serine/threonine-protein kinase n=1 Tax=Quercus suber TaxID=58331 RepID=A0AAW0LCC6_QUESU